MRKTSTVILIVCLLTLGVLAVGCGSGEVQYISPSGKTYTPAQFRSELRTLYDDYKGAKEKFEKDDSENNLDNMINKAEALVAFLPGTASIDYDEGFQPKELSPVSEKGIIVLLSLDDEKLKTAIEGENRMNEMFKEERGD